VSFSFLSMVWPLRCLLPATLRSWCTDLPNPLLSGTFRNVAFFRLACMGNQPHNSNDLDTKHCQRSGCSGVATVQALEIGTGNLPV